MLKKARCTNVSPVNADFLTTSPDDTQYKYVTHMYVRCFCTYYNLIQRSHSLLDPSCSGSGIVNRLDHLLESGATPPFFLAAVYRSYSHIEAEIPEEQTERLNKLAGFQLMMIRHAMKCKWSSIRVPGRYDLTCARQSPQSSASCTPRVVSMQLRTSMLFEKPSKPRSVQPGGSSWHLPKTYCPHGLDGDYQRRWITQVCVGMGILTG